MERRGVRVWSNGEVRVWVEQGTSIHLAAISSHGDPVELTFDEATRLATEILAMVAEAEAGESTPR